MNYKTKIIIQYNESQNKNNNRLPVVDINIKNNECSEFGIFQLQIIFKIENFIHH